MRVSRPDPPIVRAGRLTALTERPHFSSQDFRELCSSRVEPALLRDADGAEFVELLDFGREEGATDPGIASAITAAHSHYGLSHSPWRVFLDSRPTSARSSVLVEPEQFEKGEHDE